MADQSRVDEQPRGRLSRRIYEVGAAARRAGTGRDGCPYSNYQKPQQRAWLAGWDSAAPAVEVPGAQAAVPVVQVQGAPMQRRGEPWCLPENQPLDREYRVTPMACHGCRRVYTDTLGQAVIVRTVHGGAAYLECRCCGHRFKLPAR